MIGLDGGPLVAVRKPFVDRANLSGARGPAGDGAGTPMAMAVIRAEGSQLDAYRELRQRVFVDEQGIFVRHDRDRLDEAPGTVVLVALADGGRVVGGVRMAPCGPATGVDGTSDDGWWTGSRLVVEPGRRGTHAIGAALVRAACAVVEQAGALRFDATVQRHAEPFFRTLGWTTVGPCDVGGRRHVAMRWPIDRAERLAAASKAPLAAVLQGLAPGGPGWIGDDAAPVDGSDLVAACDAILPAMVERDPDWAGWCSVLVNVNDLAAMGATPVALLDAVGAPSTAAATRIVAGLRRAADTYGVSVIGGHTQIGVPASLAVTVLGRTAAPVPGGGGRAGDDVRLTVDLGGGWRPGYRGSQWDSTSSRTPEELRSLIGIVGRLEPHGAKDVSMAGIVGTLGMLAEASGCGAELDVASVPRPAGASLGDWLTCFPGFAMLTVDQPGADVERSRMAPATSAVCGRLVPGAGVTLLWPDGARTEAIAGPVTGLGPAR